MKKIFTIILTLMLAVAIALSTSGCSIIMGELGEDHAKGKILSLLKEKYGEEFVIHNFEKKTAAAVEMGFLILTTFSISADVLSAIMLFVLQKQTKRLYLKRQLLQMAQK